MLAASESVSPACEVYCQSKLLDQYITHHESLEEGAYTIINSDAREGEALSTINGENLNWRVLNGDGGDGGVCQVVGIEELWLSLASVTSFAIPPTIAISVQYRARGTLNSYGGSTDRDQWPIPFFVALAHSLGTSL